MLIINRGHRFKMAKLKSHSILITFVITILPIIGALCPNILCCRSPMRVRVEHPPNDVDQTTGVTSDGL